MTHVQMRVDGEYFAMTTPAVEGLTVESVDVSATSMRLRFTDGSVLSITRRVDEPEFHVLHLIETGELVES